MEVARLPPLTAMSSLSEVESLLEVRFEAHPLAGATFQSLERIRSGLKLGPSLEVAGIAERVLSTSGVVEAPLAALAVADDDRGALAAVCHVAQAASPLVAAGSISLHKPCSAA